MTVAQNRYFQFTFIVIICQFFFQGCTENPLSDNKIRGGNRQVSGNVELSGNYSPEDVYVWLEGFDYETRTNEDGDFSLLLPPKSAQANSNGVTGAFNLYFYVSNFRIESLVLQVARGEIVYAGDVFNAEGELHKPVLLSPLLDVYTEMNPDTVAAGQEGILSVRMLFQTTQQDTVRALFPSQVGSRVYPVIFQNLDTKEVLIFESTIVGIPLETKNDTLEITNNQPAESRRVIRGNASDFEPGTYRVVPYITVLQAGVPQELLNSIGPGINQLGAGYLELPFARQGGSFVVLPASGKSF